MIVEAQEEVEVEEVTEAIIEPIIEEPKIDKRVAIEALLSINQNWNIAALLIL